MSGSTRRLSEEHRVIERVLDALETTLDEAADGERLPVEFLRDVVTFSQSFIDACHHGKEEGCLFPCLERLGLPADDGPIAVMLREHEIGRGLVRQIASALDEYERGVADRDRVVDPCRSYIDLLREHIDKEDSMLFQMGDAVMTEDDDTGTQRCYDTSETRPHEHDAMVRLAALLELRSTG